MISMRLELISLSSKRSNIESNSIGFCGARFFVRSGHLLALLSVFKPANNFAYFVVSWSLTISAYYSSCLLLKNYPHVPRSSSGV